MATGNSHQTWMRRAIALAKAAGAVGEIPVGALVVDGRGQVLAEGSNRRERDFDPTAHAEIVVLRQAGAIRQDWRLSDCTLYVTLEPCPMCASAISQARIVRVVYGADDPKAGAIRSVLNLPASAASFHQPEVIGGVLEQDCRQLLQNWFQQLRQSQQLPRSKRWE
ncbi:MAG: tRNA adenosine(34) deaminase TadA [Cyanobacteria bacterium P01_E01_bin.34]